MNADQRFCPVCDQAFTEGEAVLRCVGCGVFHHPACWVRNEGCATEEEHEVRAVPLAFQPAHPPPPREPHPAEGTRLRRPPARTPAAGEEEGAAGPPEDAGGEPGGAAGMGEGEPESPQRHQVPAPEPRRPVRRGRYEPLETVPVRRSMPSIYRRHRLLGLWYVPAALLLGAAVAAAVVLAADYLGGDEGGGQPAPLPSPAESPPPVTPTAAGSPSPTPAAGSPTPGASPTAVPSPTVTPLPGQYLFGPGDRVVVVGTGDCLRVRAEPTTRGQQVSCLGDGTEAVIISGPAEADGYRWWHVRAEGIAEGWVAEDYLGRIP